MAAWGNGSAGDSKQPDWDVVRAWDEDYYAHVFLTADEYVSHPVASTDGDFLSLPTARACSTSRAACCA